MRREVDQIRIAAGYDCDAPIELKSKPQYLSEALAKLGTPGGEFVPAFRLRRSRR
jgi:hypothetical protein